MILGIGMDIADVSQVRRAMERRGARYVERYFTETERSYCEARHDPATHYTARLAAREALFKACATTLKRKTPFKPTDAEVVTDASGAPRFVLKGSIARALGSGYAIHLSLTHDAGVAAAVVVLEQINP